MKKLLISGIAALSLAACGPYSLSAAEKMAAELGARDYAQNFSGTYVGCSGQDSDGDKYVTCTVNLKGTPREILCSYKDNARGCKGKTADAGGTDVEAPPSKIAGTALRAA